MTTDKIIIDLRRGEQSAEYQADELFQLAAYNRVCRLLTDNLNRFDHLKEINRDKDLSKISRYRTHNAIFIDGDRGSGKTSFILNIQSYINSNEHAGNHSVSARKNRFLFLDPIDPTLLTDSENFLSVVLGQINRHLTETMGKNRQDTSRYFASLEKVASALEHSQTSGERFGLDRLLSYQSSLDLEENLHDFFQKAADFADNREAIVIPIDDVDMSLSKGFEILDIIRKYLSSPYVIPIITGDLGLYKRLVFDYFYGELTKGKLPEKRKEGLEKVADDLTVQYLRKVFPVQNRITLIPIIDMVESRATDVNVPFLLKSETKDERSMSVRDLLRLCKHIFHLGINGEENSHRDFYPRSARELVQFLKNCEKPIKALHDMPAAEILYNTPAKESDIRNLAVYIGNTINEKDKNIYLDFLTCFEKHWQNQQEKVLHLIAQTSLEIADLDKLSDKKSIFRRYSLFNPLHKKNIFKGLPDDKACNLYDITRKMHDSSKNSEIDKEKFKFLPHDLTAIQPCPGFDPIDKSLRISKANIDIARKNVHTDFLVQLFTHSDYYSSYQTIALVFFGKFFELVSNSLVQDVNEVMIKRILNDHPFHSIFSGAPAINMGVSEEETEEYDPPDDDQSSRLNVFIKDLAEEINSWRKDSGVPVCSATLLSLSMDKYFGQLNLFKLNRTGKEKERLQTIACRCKYILWNSFACFEKDLLSGIDPRIVHQNIAVGKPESLGNIETKDQSYLINIKPLLTAETLPEQGDLPGQASPLVKSNNTFTRSLSSHPLFKRIDSYTTVVGSKELPSIPVTPQDQDTTDAQTRHKRLKDARVCKDLNSIINLVFGDKVAKSKERLSKKFSAKESYSKKFEEFIEVVSNIDLPMIKDILKSILENRNIPHSYFGVLYSMAKEYQLHVNADKMIVSLFGQYWSEIDLKNVDFSNIKFSIVDLSPVKFSLVELQGANLQGADFRGVDLQEANLQGANLQGADLLEVRLLQANLEGANLQRANLRGANSYGANLQKANLQKANLLKAVLREAVLREADLREADLRGANLEGADLKGADLKGADLEGADLEGADLEGADLEGANLEGANLEGANLEGANFKGVAIHTVSMDKANIEKAISQGAIYNDPDLKG